jgi:hypothetical protein
MSTEGHSSVEPASEAMFIGDAGSPGDAYEPFVGALVAATETAGTEPESEPSVGATMQLGWLMDDIIVGRAGTPFPDELHVPRNNGI